MDELSERKPYIIPPQVTNQLALNRHCVDMKEPQLNTSNNAIEKIMRVRYN